MTTTSIGRRYDAYKASGMDWLGEIPAHWGIDRAKSLFRKMLRPTSKSDDIITVFRDGQVTLRKNRRTSGFTNSIKEIGYQRICKGDLVIHAMDAFAGAIGVSDSDGKGSPVYSAYVPVDPKRVFIPYYGLLVRQMALSGFVSSLGKGIRERSSEFRHKEFAPLELPVPPFAEQQAIAVYLDAKTAQIDRKIDLLTQKAAKYRQLKQSLINEAVTRGLDKSAPMKDSGIDWVGTFPAHWKDVRIGDIAVQRKWRNTDLVEQNLLSLSYGKLVRKDINTSFGLLPESFETYQIVNPGNIILRLTDLQNDWTSLRVGLARERGIITSAYLCLHFASTIYPAFAYYLLHVYDIRKVFYRFGGGLRQSMKWDDIKVLPFHRPSVSEQKSISEYLDSRGQQIDQIVTTINNQIDQLKELRKALINDVVTGKLRVA